MTKGTWGRVSIPMPWWSCLTNDFLMCGFAPHTVLPAADRCRGVPEKEELQISGVAEILRRRSVPRGAEVCRSGL